MVAVKTVSTTRADLDTISQATFLGCKEAKIPLSFAGFIFVCSNATFSDLERGIFGLPLSYAPSVLAIQEGMPLFLFNHSTRCLCGVFEAASNGGINIDPHAWQNFEVRRSGKAPVSRYPAQVRVRVKFQKPPLDEETFRPVLDHADDGHKFWLELTLYQVKELLSLFSISENEFFSTGKKWLLQSSGTRAFSPESPRSAFKLDSDCCSECFSKGTYCGEDDWPDENRSGRETTPLYLLYEEQQLCDAVSRLSVSDSHINNYNLNDEYPEESLSYDTIIPPLPHFIPAGVGTTFPHIQHSNLKRGTAGIHYHRVPDIVDLEEVSQLPSRFCDSLFSTQSNIHQHESEDIEPSHLGSVYLPAPLLGHENMCNIPAVTQTRQHVSLPLQPKGSKKELAGLQQPPKQALRSEHYEVSNSKARKAYAQHHPIIFEGPQYGQILVPVCLPKPGSIFEANQIASVLSPVLLSSYGQGVSLAQSQFDTLDSVNDHEGHVNYSPTYAFGYQNICMNGQFPVVILPTVIPRMPHGPPPIATGFIEELHFNILQFARLTRPSAEFQLFVESSIDCVRCCVQTVWPNADVEVYGSFATGLCLQHSDVDVVVVNAPLLPALVNMTTSQASSFLLRELGLFLMTVQVCERYTVIGNASVPVLKCLCGPNLKLSDSSLAVPPIAIDITIGGIENSSYEWKHVFEGPNMSKLKPKQHTGGAAREYVLSKIWQLPALAPLVFVMKSFLHHRGLSNVYLGGLGSFSLTLLLAYYLERVPLLEEKFAFEDISSLKISSSGILPDILEELKVPVTADASLDEYPSNDNFEYVNWSLGQHFVRKAARLIEKMLAFWEHGRVAYLGTLLLGFLQSFGFERDLACEKIVLMGTDGSPGGSFKRENRHIALWIDDPLRPGVNIAAGSFGMCEVQAAFREMFLALISGQILRVPLHCNEKGCEDLAAFDKLSKLSMLLVGGIDHQHHGGFEG